MRRIAELDGLRAVAVLLVIPSHYTGLASLAAGLPEFGFIGVDIFFVLSGYLITSILLGLRTKPTPYKTFYSRRVIRIFPPYFATIFLIMLAALAGHHYFVLSGDFLVRQFLFLQAYIPGTCHFLAQLLRHPLMHLPDIFLYAHHLPGSSHGLWPAINAAAIPFWSLSIEEYFYLLWAPVVLRCSRKWILAIGVAVCVVEILLRWLNANPSSYFNLFFRFDALLFGALLALLFELWRRTSVPDWASSFFFGLLSICVLLLGAVLWAVRPILDREIRFSPLVQVVGYPAFEIAVACLIALLILRANSDWWLARMFRTRPFQYIGTISYTMYLVHMFAGWIVQQLATVIHQEHNFVILQNIFALVLTIALARLSWHYMEKPLLRWKDRRFPNSPHPPEPVLN